MSYFQIKRHDTGPSLRVQALDADGEPLDLTGASAVFNLRPVNSSTPQVSRSAAVVEDGTDGYLRYDWQDGDTDTAGRMWGEFEVETAAGQAITVPNGDSGAGRYIDVRIGEDIA